MSYYIDHLYSQYRYLDRYADTLEHQHLHWYAAVAEANDYGCILSYGLLWRLDVWTVELWTDVFGVDMGSVIEA